MSNNVTVTLSRTKTLQQNKQDKSRLYVIDNPVVDTETESYSVDCGALIGKGGESLVYKATRLSDSQIVVFKFYDQYVDTPLTNSNRAQILNVLKEAKDYTVTHLMPILDHGYFTVTIDEEQYIKPFDILPYCENGHVIQADLATLKNRVIPEISTGLHYLHKHNFLHRDVKPSNIYYYDDCFILADFGIASQITTDNKFAFTTQKHGSIGYCAPEVSQAYASELSDFYSFGCSIVAILNGKHPYQALIDSGNEGELYLAMKKNGIPLKTEDEKIYTLVQALTQLDESKRAGYEDIILFYSDPDAFIRKFENAKRTEHAFEFNFEGKVYHNASELVEAFASNWEAAKKYLYKGGANNSPIVNLMNTYDQSLAIKAIEIIEDDNDTIGNYDLGLARFLHYFATSCKKNAPIYWKGQVFSCFSDIADKAETAPNIIPEIQFMLKSKFLLWKVEHTNLENKKEIVAVLTRISELCSMDADIAYYYFMYCFLREAKSNVRPEAYFKLLTEKRSFYLDMLNIVNNKWYLAYLAYAGHYDSVKKLLNDYSGNDIAKLELIYRFFESICDEKKDVRIHYRKFGPRAYLFNWVNSLDDYIYINDAAKQLKQQTQNLADIPDTLCINDIHKNASKIKSRLKEFMLFLQNNRYLANMGITEEKSIFPKTENGFFDKKFFNTDITSSFYHFVIQYYDL